MTETQLPQITIPADLRPADGRFGAGPSKVRAEQVAAIAEIAPTYLGTSHRQKTVKAQVARLRQAILVDFMVSVPRFWSRPWRSA